MTDKKVSKKIQHSSLSQKAAPTNNGGFSYEDYKRIVKLWCLPESFENKIMHTSFFTGVIEPLARVEMKYLEIYSNDALNVFNCFGKESLDAFRQELSIIITLYKRLNSEMRPTKEEMKKSLNQIKKIQENLSALDASIKPFMQKRTFRTQNVKNINKREVAKDENSFDYYEEKPEFYYIKDLVIKEYQNLRKEHHRSDDVPIAVKHFFETISWVNSACNRIDGSQFLNDYIANGRLSENRDKALVALASSYHLCFNKMPTKTDSNNPCFYICAEIFFQRIGELNREDGKKELSTHTVPEIIRKAVVTYKEQNILSNL